MPEKIGLTAKNTFWGITITLLLLLTACDSTPMIGKSSLAAIPNECIVETQEEKRLIGNNHILAFRKTAEGFQTIIRHADHEMFYQQFPARITVRGNDTISAGNYVEKEYVTAYQTVIQEKFGFRAIAEIQTEKSSTFIVEDKYTLLPEGIFVLFRDIKVVKAAPEDAGFASIVSFTSPLHSSSHRDYEYFIPSILYRNTSETRETAIAADLNVDQMYVKETRTGMPLAMIHEKSTRNTLTLMHYKPAIDVKENPGGGLPGD